MHSIIITSYGQGKTARILRNSEGMETDHFYFSFKCLSGCVYVCMYVSKEIGREGSGSFRQDRRQMIA
jgi:hypothetical protein